MFKHDIYVKCNLRSVGVFYTIQIGLNALPISYQANTCGISHTLNHRKWNPTQIYRGSLL